MSKIIALTDLPKAWVEMMQLEWNKRNKLGKLLYAVWLVYSTLQWAMALIVISIVVIGSWYIEVLERPVIDSPSIYKESERK